MPSTKTRAARSTFQAADLFDRLDAAMRLWPRRQLEPSRLVEKVLDDLHEAWAAVRLDLGDDLESPPPRPRAAPKPRGARDERGRTRTARARKAADDERRERYIVKRYAVHVRKATSPKAAREAVAEEVRRGFYLPSHRTADWKFVAPYEATYSEKSVARVLKKYETR